MSAAPSTAPTPRGPTAAALASPGQVLALVTEGTAETRADIARLTGLARSTVSQRVEALIAHGFLDERAEGETPGARMPRKLTLRTRDHLVAGVGLGATHCRVSLLDIGGEELATQEDPLLIGEGPDAVLEHVARTLHALLAGVARPASSLRAIGVGVPGPVEFRTGRLVDPPLMPGWHQYPIPRFFADRFGVNTLVDNDVNMMALGEQRRIFPGVGHLLFVKVGTGIGCGVIADGRLHRGAQGSAGDIGHIRVGVDSTPCRCGNAGCLEAVAGGAALARRLGGAGTVAASGSDVGRLVRSGNHEAVRMVREAGRCVGDVLSGLINFFNPEAIVLGGALAGVRDQLIAGVREAVYLRSHPLATQHLMIEPSRTKGNAAALGAALLATDHVLSPARVDAVLARAAPWAPAPAARPASASAPAGERARTAVPRSVMPAPGPRPLRSPAVGGASREQDTRPSLTVSSRQQRGARMAPCRIPAADSPHRSTRCRHPPAVPPTVPRAVPRAVPHVCSPPPPSPRSPPW
ncbi:ROK family transcriptional regulator [Streptomyces sp. SBT349]|uniref:ROK family transcriptional regulator n=1 Tax=Streptomyces sp. SBT349 TaxID=1580539 RepID=UPI00099B967E|nr:ROK family transcriptional regulator [Streptomyces sp. SBT349]